MTVDPATWFVDAAARISIHRSAQHSAVAVAICKLLDTEVEASGRRPAGHCVE